MRYKKFLIKYKSWVVGTLPNGDEIEISEMDDFAGDEPQELLDQEGINGYTRDFFRTQITNQFGDDYLFDDADYIDTDITLQGKNVDKWVNRFLVETKLNESTKQKYRNFIKTIGASVLYNHFRFMFWGYATIQKKKDVYTKGIYNQHLSAKTVENTLNYLLKIGWLRLKREPRSPISEKGGATARYDFSRTWIDDFMRYKIGIENLTYVGNPIRLKAFKGGYEREVPYSNDENTNDMRQEMFFINDYLGKQELYIKPNSLKRYCKKHKLEKKIYNPEGYFVSNYRNNYYERIFSRGNFGKGGRLYSHWVLNAPKELRRSLLLNQEDTVELDYSSMNMHIMSSLENLSSNSGKDLYQIATLKGLNRTIIKQFITIAPNVKNITTAKKLTAQEILGKKYPNVGSIPKKFLHDLEKCIAEIRIVHAILWGKYFKNTKTSKDWGIKFMFYESNIATAVVKSAALKRIPAFPIHDGFITNKKYKTKLTQIMHDEFEKYFIALDKDPSIPAIK
mgnify:FL=1|jgi:hypothetical protein